MKLNFTNPLIVFAMKEEAQGLFEKEGFQPLYTGLGKVNAAYQLTRALWKQKNSQNPPWDSVINFGTAGSFKFPTHSVIECNSLVQRDMDLSPLGFKPGLNPFESTPFCLEFPPLFPELKKGVCGTGDNFETGSTKVDCDIVDMEAYALAKICWEEKLPFTSVKYVTDGSDHNAHNDWKENLPKAAKEFIRVFSQWKR